MLHGQRDDVGLASQAARFELARKLAYEVEAASRGGSIERASKGGLHRVVRWAKRWTIRVRVDGVSRGFDEGAGRIVTRCPRKR